MHRTFICLLLLPLCACGPRYRATGTGAHRGTRLPLAGFPVVVEVCVASDGGTVALYLTDRNDRPVPPEDSALVLLVHPRGAAHGVPPVEVPLAAAGESRFEGHSPVFEAVRACHIAVHGLHAGGQVLPDEWFEYPGGMPLIGYSPDHPYNHRRLTPRDLAGMQQSMASWLNGSHVEMEARISGAAKTKDGWRCVAESGGESIPVTCVSEPPGEGPVRILGVAWIRGGRPVIEAYSIERGGP